MKNASDRPRPTTREKLHLLLAALFVVSLLLLAGLKLMMLLHWWND